MSELTYLAEENQRKLEDYERMRYENTQLRQEVKSLERKLKAIDYAHSSSQLKERQKTIFKLNDALKKIEEDEDFFLDQEVEWNKQKSFIEGKINALTNL